MTTNLADAQKRVLLSEMAKVGSAATQMHEAGEADMAAQRQAALASAVGASSGAGGVNDVAGLLDRRSASLREGEAARQGDLTHRAQAYSSDLDLAEQGNVSRRSEIDRGVSTKRSELDRAIAGKRADMESMLAIKRLELEAKRRALQEEAENEANDPVKQASRLRALLYMEDPDGTEKPSAGELRERRDDEKMATAAGISLSNQRPGGVMANVVTDGKVSTLLGQVRKHPDYGKAVIEAQQAGRDRLSPEAFRLLLERDGLDPQVASLAAAEYLNLQRKNMGRAAPASSFEEA